MNTNDNLKNQSRRDLISMSTLALAAGLPLAFTTRANAEEEKPMLMFVQLANDLKVDKAAQTLRLINVAPQTLYFADRPERIAGHVTMANYLAEWTSKAGSDNFGKDPPNAALSVYEPGQSKNTLAVVVLSNPKVDGADLVYSFKLLSGDLPAAGGATAVFIDWIGVGGGVGFGFHGVGVGFRGRGFR